MLRATMCPSSGEVTVSIRHWDLSHCVVGVWSAGWSSHQPADQTPTIQVANTTVAKIEQFLQMIGSWLPEICTEE